MKDETKSEHPQMRDEKEARVFAMKHFFGIVSLIFFVLLAACAGSTSPNAAKQALALVNTDVEKIIADARPVLVELAKVPETRGEDAANCTSVMAEKLKAYSAYTAFGAAHLDGALFCLSQTQTTPVNITDRAYFQRTVATKDFSVGDYQIGRVTGKQSVGFGYPLLDASGAAQGIVLAPLDLDGFNQRLAQIKLPEGAEVIVLDSKGNVLARVPDSKTWVGKSVADSAIGKAMLAQIDGAGEFAGLDNVTRVFAFTAPQGSNKNWIVAVGLKK